MPAAAQLNYVRTGPRGHPPVVLLHSAGLDLTYRDRQIADLSRRHDVIALDLPGHGRSSTGPESVTIFRVGAAGAQGIATGIPATMSFISMFIGISQRSTVRQARWSANLVSGSVRSTDSRWPARAIRSATVFRCTPNTAAAATNDDSASRKAVSVASRSPPTSRSGARSSFAAG